MAQKRKQATPRKPREFGDPERVQEEMSMEVGMDEAWKANIKFTYDSLLHNWQVMTSRAQTAHDTQLASIMSNMDLATKNIIAQCQLNMGSIANQAQLNLSQAADHLTHSKDRLWSGSDTAQGAVDVETIRATTIDDLALKIAGLAASVEAIRNTK